MIVLFAFAAFAADPEPPGELVVVTGEAVEGPDPSATSASVTVLVPDARTPASADVGTLLERAAGTHVERMGGLGDFAAVSLRGASLRQVEVFLDGVPLNPDGADVVDLSQLPLAAFSRVDVWRGNAPLSFGASPIGGVVDLVTRDEPGGRVSATYGSWDTARATAFAAGKHPLGGSGEAGVDGQAFADVLSTRDDFTYFDDNGTLYNGFDDHLRPRGNNDKLQATAFARGGYSRGSWRFSLADAPLYRDEGLPGTGVVPAESSRLTTARNLAVFQAVGCGTTWTATLTGWHLFRTEELEDPEGELDGTPRDEVDQGHTGGLRLAGVWAPLSWLVPSATLGARLESLATDEHLRTVDEPIRQRLAANAAIGVDVRAFGDRLLLSPAATLEVLDSSLLGDVADSQAGGTSAASPVLLVPNPRLGVLVKPLPFLALKANGGHYLRAPDLTELFGEHGTLEGNSGLLPETGWQADVGARFELPNPQAVRLSVDAAAFWLVSENRIVWVQNSQRSMTPVNFGDTWVQGVEGAVSLSAFDVFDSDTAVTWQLSRNLTVGSAANNELPRTPPLSVNEAVSVHWQERARLGYTFSYTAANYWDAANLYQSAPRVIHSVFVRIQPTPRWPRVELSGLNLADTYTQVLPRNPADPTDPSRVVAAVTDFSGYPLPGRTFLLDLSWDL